MKLEGPNRTIEKWRRKTFPSECEDHEVGDRWRERERERGKGEKLSDGEKERKCPIVGEKERVNEWETRLPIYPNLSILFVGPEVPT